MRRSILFRPSFVQRDRAADKSIVIDSKRHSIRNLCNAFLARGRRRNDCRVSTMEPPKKNKRRASTPPRRVDLTERGKDCERDEGCPRSNRSDPRDPSPKHRGSVASSIVTNCLVKEGPYMYKDRPPPPPSTPFPPPPLISFRTYCGSKHNTRASRRSSIDSPSGI